MTYQIYFRPTGELIGKPYTCIKRARRRVDTLDNNFGAYRYAIKTIETPNTQETK